MNRMNSKMLLVLLLLPGFPSFGSEAPTKSESKQSAGIWRYINYEFPQKSSKDPIFLVTSGEQWNQVSRGLRLDIMNIVQGFRFFKTNSITARLHRASGEIVEPTAADRNLLNSPVSTSWASRLADGEFTPQVITYFAWGTNAFEEAWIEISIAAERYWLEIPYGLDRNPEAALPHSITGGPPKFFPMMNPLAEHDHVLRWKNVEYDLGETQNHWQLSLIQSNPIDAESEVVLYREDIVVGKSTYLWDLHTPRTSLSVLDNDGNRIGGFCTDIRLHDDGMRRSDTFHIGRNAADSRCWGRVDISVEGNTYKVAVPSSLYKYTHGHVPIDGSN